MKSSPLAAPSVDTRHYGIDALRILSIYFVLILHILGLGGVLNATSFPDARYLAAWMLETASYCSINCYALITGYVMINNKYRYANLLLLWLQVALVSVSGTLLFYFIKPGSVTELGLLFSAFPVFRKTYWYFSSYFALYLLVPLLNRGLHSLNHRQAKALCILLVLTLSVIPTLMDVDVFNMGGGYSLLWLMALYIFGACIRKFNFGAKIKSSVLMIGFVFSVLLSVGVFALLHLDRFSRLLIVWRKTFLILPDSPTLLFNAIALLLLFSRVQVKKQMTKKLIRLVSPVSFGVYILHAHPHIARVFLLGNQFAPFADYSVPLMIGAVLLSAAGMFVFFGIIEKVRIWLFDVLKLKKRLQALEEKYIGDLWGKQK